MSISKFDPSKFMDFGTAGQATVEKMSEALGSHSLSITYDRESEKFTILESSGRTKMSIENILREKSYWGWCPEVLVDCNSLGNRVIQLKFDSRSQGDIARTIIDEERKKLQNNKS